MRNNETGEFELVVGNRQLVSGFFIVVLLFAVAFAMGYVVGQNSPRSSKVETVATATPSPVASPMPNASQPSPAPAQPPASDSAPPAAAPGDSAAAPPAAASDSAAPPASGSAAPADADGSASGVVPGSYWQVAAIPDADAQIYAKSLKEKGFPVVLTPAPNNLVRVLVGPYADKTTLGKAKTDLENAGLHTILRKL